MTTTDLLRPSPRPEVAGHGEIAALIETFNTMLDRLEAARATSRATTAAQGAGGTGPGERPHGADHRDPDAGGG